MRLAAVFGLWCCAACRTTDAPAAGIFSGDFVLVRESDWSAGQACQYVASVDQTVCSWGRLSVTVDSVARSVFGSDVHQGDRLGPVVHQDSVVYAVRFGAGNGCSMFIAGNTVKPNGPGVLATDTLQFVGYTLLGDTVRWVYAGTQVTQPRACG